MSILSAIFSKIFPTAHPANTVVVASAPTASSAPVVTIPMPEINVEQMLDDMTAKSTEALNWKTSIVDLMKLLGLDSSLSARKSLAQELNYPGAADGSAEMNTWLHRQVMTKVAANGGKVPADLVA